MAMAKATEKNERKINVCIKKFPCRLVRTATFRNMMSDTWETVQEEEEKENKIPGSKLKSHKSQLRIEMNFSVSDNFVCLSFKMCNGIINVDKSQLMPRNENQRRSLSLSVRVPAIRTEHGTPNFG